LEIAPGAPSRTDFRAVAFRIPLMPPMVAAGASSRTMKIETLSVDFTDEQKRYLEGFATGLQISRVGRGLGGANTGKTNPEPSGPDASPAERSLPIRRNISAKSIRSMLIRG
jgi:hypothetical protein